MKLGSSVVQEVWFDNVARVDIRQVVGEKVSLVVYRNVRKLISLQVLQQVWDPILDRCIDEKF